MHLFMQTPCSLRVCFFTRQSKHTSRGEPMRPQGWFWGEEMCIYLSAGCWLTLSPAWIRRCRLASAEKYSVCVHRCVCVPFSSVTVAAARLPPRSLNQLFNIDASTRFPGATNTSHMSSEVEKREKQFIPRRWRSEFLAIAQFALFRIELGVSISRFDTHVCLSVNKCCHCLYSLSPVYQTG